MSPLPSDSIIPCFEMGVHANPFRFQNCERIDGDRVAEKVPVMAGPASGRE